MMKLPWKYDDGGAPTNQSTCVARAICIATGLSYSEVRDLIREEAGKERPKARKRIGRARGYTVTRSSPTLGVFPRTTRRIMDRLGWRWVPCMGIGTGCRVHLAKGELPDKGPIIARISKHIVAVVDGVVHDTHDCTRRGTRCVYGYWEPGEV